MEKKEKIKVLYHNDMDGYGSAYAAWKYFGNTVVYYVVDHGDKLPINKGDVIYMLDFSIKKSDMLKQLKIASKIIVVDHHENIAKQLTSIKEDNFEITYDKNKSGATLSWAYFHKSKPPKILEHIQDYDIWAFKIPKTKEVSIWLQKHIYDPKNKSFKDLDKIPDIKKIYSEGAILLDAEDKEIEEILKKTYEVEFEGKIIGVVDYDEHYSKLGNKLAEKYPFGVVRGNDPKNKDQYVYGIRSIGSFDVSAIARKYGGNGHKNSAGFAQPKSKEIWKVL